MGTVFSSNKDFNQILASQPRAAIRLLRFDVPDNLHQYPLTKTLSIPAPVRHKQSNIRIPVASTKLLRSESNQALIEANTAPLIKQKTVDKQPSSDKQLYIRSASYTSQLNHKQKQLTMNVDARIIYRSVTNLNLHRRTNNQQLSSFEPQRLLVERNGKQFITELKERMEKRHVQIFDEKTGRMRLFEVLDYVPTRVVRLAKSNSQIQSQNNDSQSSNSSSESNSNHSKKENHRIASGLSSNFHNVKDSNHHQKHADEFNLYQRGGLLPTNNNNSNNTFLGKQSSGQGFINNDRYQSREYDKVAVNSRGTSSQYVPGSYRSQPVSYRHHSANGSEYSESTSTDPSTTSDDGSDSEGYDRTYSSNNQTGQSIFYGTRGGRHPPIEIDPFQKSIHPHTSYYKKRQHNHNYSQPVTVNTGFSTNPALDYTLLIH